jgi:hypothetical protein
MDGMTVYQTNAAGVYVGEALARESPLEPGVYLIPARAVTVAPPAVPEGHAVVWDEAAGAWSLVEDHRGRTIYATATAEAMTMVALGPIPAGYTDQVPPAHPIWVNGAWSVDLAAVIAARREIVQAEKFRVRDAGFLVDGVLFDSDQGARLAYLEFAMELASDPSYSNPHWKASPGIWVTMNAELFASVRSAGEAHMTAAFDWQAARDAELAAIQAAVAAGTMTNDAALTAIEAVSTTYEGGEI